MTTGWFYLKSGAPGGQQTGPVTWEQLCGLTVSGAVGPQDLVWNAQLPDWLPPTAVPGLFPAPTAAAAPPPAAAQAAAPWPAARPPARRRSWLLPVLIPVIALIVVGGGLGSYFAFWHGDGSDKGGTVTTGTIPVGSQTTSTAKGSAIDLGTADGKAPDVAKLVETTTWGEVPANQIVVITADGTSRGDADSLATTLGGTVVGEVAYINAYQIETAGSTEADLTAALDKAATMPGVELAFPNIETVNDTEIWGVPQSPLSDPVYGNGRDKGFELIGAPKAWTYVRGSGLSLWDVHVGVVDTGLYKGTGEFDGDVNVTFLDRSAGELSAPLKDTNDDTGITVDDPTGSHAGLVVGQLGADSENGGQTGLASPVLGNHLTVSVINHSASKYGNKPVENPDPNDPTVVKLSNGKGYSYGSLVAITEQIKDGAKVINCSWGTDVSALLEQNKRFKAGEITAAEYQAEWNQYQAVAASYKRFFEKMSEEHPDVLFVCSAGNDGWVMPGSIRFPSGLDLPNMVTVGNVMNDGSKVASSNMQNTEQGQEFEVTLAAPGQQVIQAVDAEGNPITNETDIGNGHKRGGGTSAAAPQVSAAAAILLSLNPDLTAGEIKDILSKTARPGPVELGGKILAVDQAVLEVINQQREKQGLPAVTGEELEKAGMVDAVATTTDTPDVYSVRGILAMVPSGGTDVTISGSAGVTVEEGEAAQSLTAAGEVQWPGVRVAVNDPKNPTTITVTRKDTGAASIITLRSNAGTYKGTYLWNKGQTPLEFTVDVEGKVQGGSYFEDADMDATLTFSGQVSADGRLVASGTLTGHIKLKGQLFDSGVNVISLTGAISGEEFAGTMVDDNGGSIPITATRE
jgi:hypothetical protein